MTRLISAQAGTVVFSKEIPQESCPLPILFQQDAPAGAICIISDVIPYIRIHMFGARSDTRDLVAAPCLVAQDMGQISIAALTHQF